MTMIKLQNIVFWQKVIREIYFILESVKPKASVRKLTVKARLVSRGAGTGVGAVLSSWSPGTRAFVLEVMSFRES